jgi:cell wall-associated NlpC family hydrolase
MSDPRETPANGRVAHVSLKGQVDTPRFAEGEILEVNAPVANLVSAPDGPRERELLLGQGFRVLDVHQGWAFGMSVDDGYVGYVADTLLSKPADPTHRVSVIRSYAKPSPSLKATEEVTWLSFGARVNPGARDGDWSEVQISGHSRWMPSAHLAPVTTCEPDPVAVAVRYLGTPYLWGGNSSQGIDCSGLVQAAMFACGIPCPGDSDQQEARLGDVLPDATPPARGDLYFWKGHVGILSDPQTLLHANAHAMAVTYEPLDAAIARIALSDGPVTARRRVNPPVNPPRG